MMPHEAHYGDGIWLCDGMLPALGVTTWWHCDQPVLLFEPVLGFSEQLDLLLLEVPPLLLVHQHQVQEVPHAELVVDVLVGWGELVRRKEQPDGDVFAAHGRAVHYFVLGQRLALVVQVGARAGGLPAPYLDLHVLELDAHQQEVYLPHNGVQQAVHPLPVLKLDVEAVLDAHLHLDGVRFVSVLREAAIPHPEGEVLDHVTAGVPRHRHTEQVSKLHLGAVIRVVLHLDVAKLEVHCLCLVQLPRRGELPH
mmetsp:Transcript_1081/g.2535  ORF Transcript_1081/g.2535 Transcript_1081/m.2535 type:complete len:252 (+) Transcript_1081:258-1013(+)